jgi:hypothetical protein
LRAWGDMSAFFPDLNRPACSFKDVVELRGC